MTATWKIALIVSWAATFFALVFDEISEHVDGNSSVYLVSLVMFGICMAIAFIAGCMATAALFSLRKNQTK